MEYIYILKIIYVALKYQDTVNTQPQTHTCSTHHTTHTPSPKKNTTHQ